MQIPLQITLLVNITSMTIFVWYYKFPVAEFFTTCSILLTEYVII